MSALSQYLLSVAVLTSCLSINAFDGPRSLVRAVQAECMRSNDPDFRQRAMEHFADVGRGMLQKGASPQDCEPLFAFARGVDIQEIHQVAEHAQRESMQRLLNRGHDINAQSTYSGITPLHCGVSKGNKDYVQFLVESNADPRLRDIQGKSVLMHAILAKQKHVPTLDYALPEYNAAFEELIAYLCEICPVLVACADNQGVTPLAYAIRAGDEFTVSQLVQSGAKAGECESTTLDERQQRIGQLRKLVRSTQPRSAENVSISAQPRAAENVSINAKKIISSMGFCVDDNNETSSLDLFIESYDELLYHFQNLPGMPSYPISSIGQRSLLWFTLQHLDEKYARMLIENGAAVGEAEYELLAALEEQIERFRTFLISAPQPLEPPVAVVDEPASISVSQAGPSRPSCRVRGSRVQERIDFFESLK